MQLPNHRLFAAAVAVAIIVTGCSGNSGGLPTDGGATTSLKGVAGTTTPISALTLPVVEHAAGRVTELDGTIPPGVATGAKEQKTLLRAPDGTGHESIVNRTVRAPGPALQANFGHIVDIAVDKAGVIYVADDNAGRVRAIGADGKIATVAGGGSTPIAESGGLAKEGTAATSLNLLSGAIKSVAVDSKGTLYVALADAILRLDAKGGIQVVIGDVGDVVAQSGKPANQTRVLFPGDLACHDGTLFYIDGNDLHSIVNVDA